MKSKLLKINQVKNYNIENNGVVFTVEPQFEEGIMNLLYYVNGHSVDAKYKEFIKNQLGEVDDMRFIEYTLGYVVMQIQDLNSKMVRIERKLDLILDKLPVNRCVIGSCIEIAVAGEGRYCKIHKCRESECHEISIKNGYCKTHGWQKF